MNRSIASVGDRRVVAGRVGSRVCGRRRAFTLIELLTVVAILSLLMTMLLPTLGKAKEQARMVVCKTNLRSLGIAFFMYTQQGNEWYPAGSGFGGDTPTWDVRLEPYHGNKQLFHCPADKQDRTPFYDLRDTDTVNRYPRSYAINISISYRGASEYGEQVNYEGRIPFTKSGEIWRTTDVEIPSETIMLGEQWESFFYTFAQPGIYGDYKGHGIYTGNDVWSSTVDRFSPGRDSTPDVHGSKDRANYIFCDGQTKTLMADDPYINPVDNPNDDEESFYYYHREKTSRE